MKRFALIAALVAVCAGVQAQEKTYEVKSGIVTMEMDMMGNTIVQEICFDDYGAKKATITNFGGNKMRMLVIDGSNVMVNDAEKTATRMPMMGQEETVNFLNLDEKTIRKYKVKELGTETVAGKECKKYSITVFMMGQPQKQTVWVYKGITLKSSASSSFGEMVQVATKVQEDVEMPASTFTLPEGVQVQEMDMSMFGGGGW